MGTFWSRLFGGSGVAAPSIGIQSPWAPASDALATFTAEFLGLDSDNEPITRELALKVPGVKRAHGIHCSTVAGARWFEFDGETKLEPQPSWLTSSRSGVSPYHRMFGLTSDMFMTGWGCLGFTADPWEADTDALHIPVGLWGVDAHTGKVTIDPAVPAEYRRVAVAIPLGFGENGFLIDGRDTLTAARAIERAWTERVENPIPATDLHITNPQFDGMSKRERNKIIDAWNAGRRRSGGQTAVTQSFLEVRALGQVSADLFEKGRNAVRLDIANHAAVPASIIEGAKDGGGADINYSNDGTKPAELYNFGTVRFVQAIEARLSLDDVCLPGHSIRADVAWATAQQTPAMSPSSED